MQHTPVSRWEWEKLLLRLELPTATKTVALAAATYGNSDGSRVGPSVPRLAAELDWSEKHVQTQLSSLRDLGLIEVTRRHSRYGSTLYQLTLPGAGVETLPMRTDIDGYRVMQGPKKAGRGGKPHHKPKSPTGTGVPVNQRADRNPSSGDGDADQNRSSGEDSQHRNPGSGGTPDQTGSTGTGVPVTERSPELEFPITGTGVPQHRNSSSPDHKDQTKTNPVVTRTSPPTNAPQDHNHGGVSQTTGPTQRAPTGFPDPEAAHRAARRVLDAAPRAERDRAFAQAARELAERGIVDIRQRILRAATILTDLPSQEGLRT